MFCFRLHLVAIATDCFDFRREKIQQRRGVKKYKNILSEFR